LAVSTIELLSTLNSLQTLTETPSSARHTSCLYSRSVNTSISWCV